MNINLKPILFKPELVKAIYHDKTKTQTRRVCKGIDSSDRFIHYNDPHELNAVFTTQKMNGGLVSKNKYGRPGDYLWVRETFAVTNPDNPKEKQYWKHPKSGEKAFPKCHLTWKPAIHMPFEAARPFLRIEDIRVERLQEITEEDALAEGFTRYQVEDHNGDLAMDLDATFSFRLKWDVINPEAQWDQNPWVWRIKFSLTDLTPADVDFKRG